MKYSKITQSFIMLFFVAFAPDIQGQSLQDLVDNFSIDKMNVNTMINEAVSPALTVVRQQYRLEKDGKYYGKNRMSYFGESYSLVVKRTGGEILQKCIFEPWEDDADYLKVNKSGKYKPVNYLSMSRALSDSVFKETDLELTTEYVQPLDGDSLLYLHRDQYNGFGLDVDETAGEKTGYLILAYSSNVQDSMMQVSLKQSAFTVTIDRDSVIPIKPKNSGQLLGGIFVVPKVERAGIIKFCLVGVCTKNQNRAWVLKCLIKGGKSEGKTSIKIKKRKKEKEILEPTPIK